MLATALVEEVDRLLKEGQLSRRQIATRVGISRGTVDAIANGRRGLHGNDVQTNGNRMTAHVPPPARCPRCGYRIYAPCVIRTRDHKNRHQGLLP